jgi:hypothetical protein
VSEVRLEDFLGQPVRDADGREIGRLHEARAEREGDALVVRQFLVGTAGWLERLSLGVFGLARFRGYVVPWQLMDLSVPGKPRCTCRADELEPGGD